MTTLPRTQRARILDAVRSRIQEIATSDGIPLRKVERKAWTPNETMRPSAVVNDDGATRSGSKNQSDTVKVVLLKFQVIINLAADFGDGDTVGDWTDNIESIRIGLQNFNPKCGVIRMDVLDDTPVKVELGSASEHVWIIECECEYFVEVQAFA